MLAAVYIHPGRRAAGGLDNAVVDRHAAQLDGRENFRQIPLKGGKVLILGIENGLLGRGDRQPQGLDLAGVHAVADGVGAEGGAGHAVHALGGARLDNALTVAVQGIGKGGEIVRRGGFEDLIAHLGQGVFTEAALDLDGGIGRGLHTGIGAGDEADRGALRLSGGGTERRARGQADGAGRQALDKAASGNGIAHNESSFSYPGFCVFADISLTQLLGFAV